VTGEKFQDLRPGSDYSLLGSDEWTVLEEICEGDAMHLELMAKLLDTERIFRKKSRRMGIYEAIENCFKTSSRSQKEAIDNAHFKRDLKEAVTKGDVAKVKQLTLGDVMASDQQTHQVLPDSPEKSQQWANFKFKRHNPEEDF
jgi:DNA sulfur modification protein DndC